MKFKHLCIIVVLGQGLVQAQEWKRWFSLDQATVGTRFVGVNGGDGSTVRQQQHQEMFSGSLRLDGAGRYRLVTGLGSGPYFSGAWNHTAAGTAPGLARPFWRQMYFAAEPWRGVEFHYGGLGLEPHGTGFVGLAGVGYMTGQRLALRGKAGLDRVVLSYGYLGDFDRPDMTNRFRRLGRANYRDLILEKTFGRWTLSSQSTSFGGRMVTGLGSAVRLPGDQVARFEFYRRTKLSTGTGFHAGTEKRVWRALKLGGGYVSVDQGFGRLNSDAFWDGNRWYVSGSVPAGRGLSLSALWNHAVANTARPTMTNFVTAGINYDLLTLLKK